VIANSLALNGSASSQDCKTIPELFLDEYISQAILETCFKAAFAFIMSLLNFACVDRSILFI
jgi:hypothetical protein